MNGYYTTPAYKNDFFKVDTEGYILVLVQEGNQFFWERAMLHTSMITPEWHPLQDPAMLAFLSRIGE